MDKRSHTHKSSRIGLFIGGVLLIALIAVSSIFMEKQYRVEFTRVREQNLFIAKLVAYHTIDTLHGINQVIHAIHNALHLTFEHPEQSSAHHDHDKIVNELLRDSRAFNPYLLTLIITDGKGTPLHWAGKTKPYEIFNEEHIKAHTEMVQDQDFYVSGILHSEKDTDHPYFGISTGFRDNEGRLQYIYTALIDYNHFTRDFEKLGIPPGTSIAVGNSDGNVLMRLPRTHISIKSYPPLKKVWESGKMQGGASEISPFDHKKREIVYTRIGSYPFMAFASTSEDVILEEWWIYFWTLVTGLVVLVFCSIYAYKLFFSHQRQSLLYQDLLEEQAMLDPLTKMSNRRRFYPILEREFNLSLRHARPLALLTIDVDHFKLVNDKYGHDIGDIVLIQVAETLKDLCRKTDVSCRLGGEEFAILLSQTSFKGAATAAEKIRETISRMEIKANGEVISVTVSIGVSCFEKGDRQPKELMSRSDAALYKAKHMGRNCVFVQYRYDTMEL